MWHIENVENVLIHKEIFSQVFYRSRLKNIIKQHFSSFYLSELSELGVGRVVRDEEPHALIGDLDRGRTVHLHRLEGRKRLRRLPFKTGSRNWVAITGEKEVSLRSM